MSGTFSLLGVLLSLATRLGGPDAAMKYQNLANWVSSHGGFVSKLHLLSHFVAFTSFHFLFLIFATSWLVLRKVCTKM
jgi:hypothetical protein